MASVRDPSQFNKAGWSMKVRFIMSTWVRLDTQAYQVFELNRDTLTFRSTEMTINQNDLPQFPSPAKVCMMCVNGPRLHAEPALVDAFAFNKAVCRQGTLLHAGPAANGVI